MDDERDQYMEEGLDILYGVPVKNGQQILDAVRAQNDDNPILLQFRFKDL